MSTHSNLSGPGKQTLAPFRLRKHADYQSVYAASRKQFSASMAYFFRLRPAAVLSEPGCIAPGTHVSHPHSAPPPRQHGPRIGLTVGRVLGKAVTRNRIKRRMREAVRLHLSILHQAPPLDLILHPRKSVAAIEFTALEQEVARIFTQVAAQASGRAAGKPMPERPDQPNRTRNSIRSKDSSPRQPHPTHSPARPFP